MRNKILALFGATFLIFNACQQGPGMAVKPKALGAMNDIVVISDEDLWTAAVGDTVRHLFEGVYPITPRPESIFDLRYFTPRDMDAEPLRRELRTYMILANLADLDSETTQMVQSDLGAERFEKALTDPTFNTSIGKDKWANGQILIYVFANGVDELTQALVRNYDGISSRVNAHDAIILNQMTYARGENRGYAAKTKERFGAEIVLPADFESAKDSISYDGLLWSAKQIPEGFIHFAIRQYDYTGPDMLTIEAAKSRFNGLGILVSTDNPNSYIVATDEVLPILTYEREQDGHYMKEYRGIWETENDFYGGPFQSYSIVNTEARKLLSIDAFVFAPGKKKRDYMQQIDTIVKGLKW